MADYGIKVARTGSDITSTLEENIMLSSKRKNLKVKDVQTTTIVISGGSGTKNINHGLSFRPVVIAYLEKSSELHHFNFDFAVFNFGEMRITATQIKFSVSLTPDATYNIHYFVSETEKAE